MSTDDVIRYHPRLAALERKVLHNISGDWSLRAAAHVVGLHPSYFSSMFRRVVGITFSQWLRKCRISEAKRILEAEFIQVTIVAHSVGYDDLTTFERAFRRVEGMTPRQYRDEVVRSLRGRRRKTPNKAQQVPSQSSPH